MYEKFVSEAKTNLKPFMDLVEANANIAEKLVQQQTAYFVDALNTSVSHTKALSEVKDYTAAIETQQAYAQDMAQKLVDVSKQNVETLTEAKDVLVKITETSFSKAEAPKKAAAKKAA